MANGRFRRGLSQIKNGPGEPFPAETYGAGANMEQHHDESPHSKMVRQLFEYIDLDGNGFIEKSEMKSFLSCLGPPDGYSTSCIWEDFTEDQIDLESFTEVHNKHQWMFEYVDTNLLNLKHYKWNGKNFLSQK